MLGATFRGIGGCAMAQGIVGAFLVRVPVSLFLVGLATPCSTAVQILIFLTVYLLTAARERRESRTERLAPSWRNPAPAGRIGWRIKCLY